MGGDISSSKSSSSSRVFLKGTKLERMYDVTVTSACVCRHDILMVTSSLKLVKFSLRTHDLVEIQDNIVHSTSVCMSSMVGDTVYIVGSGVTSHRVVHVSDVTVCLIPVSFTIATLTRVNNSLVAAGNRGDNLTRIYVIDVHSHCTTYVGNMEESPKRMTSFQVCDDVYFVLCSGDLWKFSSDLMDVKMAASLWSSYKPVAGVALVDQQLVVFEEDLLSESEELQVNVQGVFHGVKFIKAEGRHFLHTACERHLLELNTRGSSVRKTHI